MTKLRKFVEENAHLCGLKAVVLAGVVLWLVSAFAGKDQALIYADQFLEMAPFLAVAVFATERLIRHGSSTQPKPQSRATTNPLSDLPNRPTEIV